MELAAPKQRRFKQLEEWTGIASDRWSAVSLGRQRPTAEMIEALCTRYPEMALWLTTGRTDRTNMQWDARTAMARKSTNLFAVLQKGRVQLSEEDKLVLEAAMDIAQPLVDSHERKAASDLKGDIAELLMTEAQANELQDADLKFREATTQTGALRSQKKPK